MVTLAELQAIIVLVCIHCIGRVKLTFVDKLSCDNLAISVFFAAGMPSMGLTLPLPPPSRMTRESVLLNPSFNLALYGICSDEGLLPFGLTVTYSFLSTEFTAVCSTLCRGMLRAFDSASHAANRRFCMLLGLDEGRSGDMVARQSAIIKRPGSVVVSTPMGTVE
jgi:hypothetical protein